jgi:DeoR family fructose operon transcriptional repressor
MRLKPHERQAQILERLRQQGYVTVDDLSQALDVSAMTIRRDLHHLQDLGLVSRHYGGATLAPDQKTGLEANRHASRLEMLEGARLVAERGNLEWPWRIRQSLQAEEKRRIGRAVATLVQDDDVIVIDAGTTTYEVAKNIASRRLTVICNFLPILCLLSSQRNINLIGIGGLLDWENQWFTGPQVIDTLQSMNANVAIMATTCLSLSKGLTNRMLPDSQIKRAMIDIAEKVILVADSSKMHHSTLATVGPIELVDIFLTDSGLSDKDRRAIEARSIEVIIAE